MLSESQIQDRVSELLKKELGKYSCAVCGNDKFVILDRFDSGLQSNLMLYEGDDPVAKKHSPLRTVACTNCGHLEQFAENPLRRRVMDSSESPA